MKNDLIVKHNKVIESKYSMTVTEAKIMAKLTSVIRKDDGDFKEHRFKVSVLLEELGIGEKNHNALEQSIDKLLSRVIEIKLDSYNKKGKRDVLKTTLLSSCLYSHSTSEIVLSYDPKLKPYFLQLKDNFTKYYLENILELKSFYSIRIYELVKQYENIKSREITINELKEILDIGNSYKLYGHFKEKVLTVAQKEINEKTDINLTFEEIKKIRKVTGIIFNTERKENRENLHIKEPKTKDKSYSDDVVKLYNLLPETERIESRLATLEKMLVEHTYEYISADIEYCKTRRVKDFFAYLVKSVKNGHYSSADIEKKKKKESAKEAKKKIAEEKKLEEEKRSEERKSRAEMRYNSLSEEEIESYKKKSGYYNIPEKIRKSVSAEDMIMVVLMEEEN